MRLYLSSHRIGERAGALLALVGSGARVAVIANGFDGASEMARQIYRTEVFDPLHSFTALALRPEMLDLRAYFGDPARLRQRLESFDLVWAMGGNSFVLRRAMRQSGFDTVIEDLIATDVLAYGGDAAGAVVAGPSLRGLELIDDPWELPDGYDDRLHWNGLRLTDFTVVPHYRSPHPEAAAAEKLVHYLRARKLPYRTIADGEAVVWTSGRDTEGLRRIA